MKSFLVLGGFLLLMGSLPVLAQSPAPQTSATSSQAAGKDYNAIINGFFDLIKQMKYKDATDCLLNSNPSQTANVPMHESLLTTLKNIGDASGDFKRFSPIIDKRFGKDIAYVYGIGIYDKHLIRFEFVFSQEDTTWELYNYSFSQNVTEELRALSGATLEPKPAGN